MRLLARRGIADEQLLYLCGEGGSPGRRHRRDGVLLLLGFVGDDEANGGSLVDANGRDFLVEVSFTLKKINKSRGVGKYVGGDSEKCVLWFKKRNKLVRKFFYM